MLRVLCSRIVLVGLLAGCSGGSSDPNRPKTAVVKGIVTYRGEPVIDAGVTFMPQSHEYTGIGRTDADGSFELRTFEPNDGAVPGDYKVTVVKFDAPAKPADTQLSDEELERRESKSEPPPPKSLVPQKYGSPKTTDLSVQVTEGTNEVKLELKD